MTFILSIKVVGLRSAVFILTHRDRHVNYIYYYYVFIRQTTATTGTGVFSDFSNIQTVNVSGAVRSHDPTTGTVTYNTELKYYFSCAYPLEYLINNTRLDV